MPLFFCNIFAACHALLNTKTYATLIFADKFSSFSFIWLIEMKENLKAEPNNELHDDRNESDSSMTVSLNLMKNLD